MYPQAQQLEQATANYELARAQVARTTEPVSEAQRAQALNQIAQAQSAIRQAQAQVVNARNNLNKLLEGPKEEDLIIARAQLKQAQLNVLQAENALANARLIAPIDGVVSQVNIKAGEIANNARPAIVLTITKTYRMGDIEVHALRGVDLDVRRGELLAIMGPSGSGKSTLMNIIGCLDQPTSGRYWLDGEDVSRMDDDRLAEVRNRRIGFVFQSFNLLARTSALDNVELPLIYGGVRNRREKARAALEAVGLGERIHHRPNELSGGQQQRVAIARALVTNPAIILADEPTGNLDSRSGEEIMGIFQQLNEKQGITIVLVTHEPDIAAHTRRIVRLQDGSIVHDEIVAQPIRVGRALSASPIAPEEVSNA
jgi:putative ABC transport system ATP-binding protein